MGDEFLDFCGDPPRDPLIPDVFDDALELLAEKELLREEFADIFLASDVDEEDEDNLIEVDKEADLVSLAELSLRNSFAEDKLLGGEEDLELAEEDFLEEAPVELLEVFLNDVVELFLVDDDEEDWPSITRPRLMASSRAISLLDSGSVKIPVFSSIRPRLSASWNVIECSL